MKPVIQPATNENLSTIVDWLLSPEIGKWLDFGPRQRMTPAALKLGITRGMDQIFTFSEEKGATSIGVVGLSQIHDRFRTAMLWYALGEPGFGGCGLTTQAVDKVLDIAFDQLELNAINAWAVEVNRPSVRILQKTGFQQIGRQRHCHYVDGQPHDRLLFDRLSNRLDGSND